MLLTATPPPRFGVFQKLSSLSPSSQRFAHNLEQSAKNCCRPALLDRHKPQLPTTRWRPVWLKIIRITKSEVICGGQPAGRRSASQSYPDFHFHQLHGSRSTHLHHIVRLSAGSSRQQQRVREHIRLLRPLPQRLFSHYGLHRLHATVSAGAAY